ncbi:hypothetical protein QTH97_18875 [Variovorax sp. J22R24]|uniref:hypothetical protein n=1 Tax=Variovorax gracilis TaxID=3053502 RepID=UPI0025783D72|nr:hypothetical protein [Variovorax sp. J22R24]MDM0107017.1 hypothetical protein [Variovorax sp. J22R24]
MALICPNCQARNRSVAKFCIECITSLPTGCADTDFAPTMRAPAKTSYAGLASALKGHFSKPAGAPAAKAGPAHETAAPSKGLWISVAGLIAALVVGSAGWMVAGAGGWYLYTAGSAQVDPPPAGSTPKEASRAEDVHPHAEAAPPVVPKVEASDVGAEAAPAIADAAAPPGAGSVAAGPATVRAAAPRARPATSAAPPRVQVHQPGASESVATPPDLAEETRPKPKPVAPPEPKAACSAMNFIAAAQCMARQCVKPEFKSHPQCEAVRRQQRLEEEKRNPVAP